MKALVVVISFIAISWARKLPMMGDLAMQNPDLFEGDILGVQSIEDRSAIPAPHMRWPGGVIPFLIDRSLTHQYSKIIKAMNHIMSKTSGCITFKKRTNEKNYILIFRGKGCYSYVGMQYGGGQYLSLGKGCHYKGTIVHELMHAVGFFHEQNRSDRDDYLTIYWDNIKEGMGIQFAKLRPHQNLLYDGFDYNSIMIYGEYAFTKRKGLKTMEAKEDGVRLKEPYFKPGLSDSDIYRIKVHYGCA